jgi:hypothetical protein
LRAGLKQDRADFFALSTKSDGVSPVLIAAASGECYPTFQIAAGIALENFRRFDEPIPCATTRIQMTSNLNQANVTPAGP